MLSRSIRQILKSSVNSVLPSQYAATAAFSSTNLLKQRFSEILPQRQALFQKLKKEHGNKVLAPTKIDQIIGGMRNMFGMVYETSLLDPRTGITMRGYSIPELSEFLQKSTDGPDGEGEEPLPESLYWLLLTGEFPGKHEHQNLQQELQNRSTIDENMMKFIKSLPKDMHPMTQLSICIMQLQTGSLFADAYRNGINKQQYWDYYFEDALNLIAKIPKIAALIYRHTYFEDKFIEADPKLDWAGNYSHMMGYPDYDIKECLRGYLTIHSDHEGGNVSAHTCHLVGSALADPYLSYAAAVNGLAGPLHGLANQEVLRWLTTLQKEVGENPSDEKIKDYVINTLNEGKVIPGYGHAVLRHTDPRFLHQKQFAAKNIKNDNLIKLVKKCYRVIPMILTKVQKIKNPWPNVDAHSGALLQHYGITQFDYYTVVFAVSRVLGCMANLIWARAYGLPIERPQSITLDWIENKFSEKSKFEK